MSKSVANKKSCEHCGTEYGPREHARIKQWEKSRFCSVSCAAKARPNNGANLPASMPGALNPAWKGGVFLCNRGYRYISVGKGKHKAEHVLAAEKVLGRPLKRGEVVHHIDGDKLNNANSNLLICTQAYHAELHSRMSYLYQQEAFGV